MKSEKAKNKDIKKTKGKDFENGDVPEEDEEDDED